MSVKKQFTIFIAAILVFLMPGAHAFKMLSEELMPFETSLSYKTLKKLYPTAKLKKTDKLINDKLRTCIDLGSNTIPLLIRHKKIDKIKRILVLDDFAKKKSDEHVAAIISVSAKLDLISLRFNFTRHPNSTSHRQVYHYTVAAVADGVVYYQRNRRNHITTQHGTDDPGCRAIS